MRVSRGDVDLYAESFGATGNPAILLIAGATASMLWWDAKLCDRLAAAGRRVIRYDQRDTGLSTTYPPGRPGYTDRDLAADAIAILDGLGVDRAHVVGQSMFGAIALVLAVDHPDRVATVTFVSSSTGAPGLPPPSMADGPPTPDFDDPAAVVAYLLESTRMEAGGSPYFDEAATRQLLQADVARSQDLAATYGNHYAMTFEGPRGGGFADIEVPTLVIHGDLDPLFPPAHGEAIRATVPAATLVTLAGAGHSVPEPCWDRFVEALVRHTAQV